MVQADSRAHFSILTTRHSLLSSLLFFLSFFVFWQLFKRNLEHRFCCLIGICIVMVSSLRVLSLPCALLLSALYTRAMAFERAVEVPQVSRRQQAFLGGWAIGIAGTECPSDVPVLCTGSIKNPACCPTGTFCFGLANTYCCPTGSFRLLTAAWTS